MIVKFLEVTELTCHSPPAEPCRRACNSTQCYISLAESAVVVTWSVVHLILIIFAALHFAETFAIARLLTDLCPGKTIQYNTIQISTKAQNYRSYLLHAMNNKIDHSQVCQQYLYNVTFYGFQVPRKNHELVWIKTITRNLH